MKFTEIRDLTVEELRKRQKSMNVEMFDLKMKHTLGQISNPLQIRALRRDLARIKTALTSKLG